MRNTSIALWAAAIAAGFLLTMGVGQESTYLAQKLMLENDLRKRISGALAKILEDHRYVLDVTVDVKFTPTVREEVRFRPGRAPSRIGEARGEEEVTEEKAAPEETPRRKSRVTGIPIPGFDFQVEEEKAEEKPPVEETAITAGEVSAVPREGAEVLSQSYTDVTSSVPMIRKMEISCILPGGSSPELIENVRQIIMVASHFDRSRGDELSIMTASFKERRDERTAEAIILRSIAKKIDQLEEKQAETDAQVAQDWREELERWKEEEGKRQDEERSVWRTELEKLENERLRREFEREKQAIVERDSLRLVELTNEINDLKALLAGPALSAEEQRTTEEAVATKEQEKAQIDSLIDEKLAMLQETQREMKRLEGGVSNLPIYLMSAISLLAVVALAAVILFNGRSRPRYVIPPPWMVRPPGKKKVKTKPRTGEGEEGEARPAAAPPRAPAPPPAQPEEDPGVLQSEIRATRQSIVSMSVGEPETATTIVREWLEEEAPPPPEEPVAAPAPTTPPAEEESGGKGKKKKKK